MAKTKYVATAEDDILYHPSHFSYRPSADDMFSYNINKWSIFSWVKPAIYSYRVRKSMSSLIVSREALVKTLTERYTKHPTLESVPRKTYKYYWGEPGRFENHLGITPLRSEDFASPSPNVIFSTSEALGFLGLGARKAHSKIRTEIVEPWGSAEEILKLYG